jgi:hypothetical protein
MILMLSIGALGVVASLTLSKLEERDTFCISCHTIPETEYQRRTLQASMGSDPALDLGSRHYQSDAENFRCIDCHRGAGTISHRLITNGLAARDTLIWLIGAADPSLEKGSVTVPMLLNAACAGCHEETLLTLGFENHFHAYLPESVALVQGGAEPIAPSESGMPGMSLESDPLETTVSCVDCHSAHVQVPGAELQGYLDLAKDVYPACETCHLDSGRGPVQLAAGGS